MTITQVFVLILQNQKPVFLENHAKILALKGLKWSKWWLSIWIGDELSDCSQYYSLSEGYSFAYNFDTSRVNHFLIYHPLISVQTTPALKTLICIPLKIFHNVNHLAWSYCHSKIKDHNPQKVWKLDIWAENTGNKVGKLVRDLFELVTEGVANKTIMSDYGPEHFSLPTFSQCNKWPGENWSFFKQSAFTWTCWNYVEICFGRENELEIWGICKHCLVAAGISTLNPNPTEVSVKLFNLTCTSGLEFLYLYALHCAFKPK